MLALALASEKEGPKLGVVFLLRKYFFFSFFKKALVRVGANDSYKFLMVRPSLLSNTHTELKKLPTANSGVNVCR